MEAPEKAVYFAKTNFRGAERTFGIRRADRRQHVYVIGKTGVGKSNLLQNFALQDIENGDGIAIVDPHGSFVEDVLESIPEHRLKDVIYLNPADTDHPIGFNILEVPDPKYKHLIASDLMGIFTKIWANVWSSRMEYILSNCILALLDTPGTTLLGIPRILVDKDYRSKILQNVKDPVVRAFWMQEYESWRDQFRNEAIVPIQNKVGQFLSTSLIRNIVGQTKSSFNVYDIMNQRKILLVNVAKGRIGEDNAALLGAMMITKIQLAAMERVRIAEQERKDFYLYVDEFQNFATESFASILSEARKYRLNLTIAHQYVGQLVTDTTTKVRDAVFGNVGTMIVFRVGAADAEFLENEFSPEFNIQDLVNLPNYNIYVKLMVNGVTSRPFSAATIPVKSVKKDTNTTDMVVEYSRSQYSRPRAQVEADIERWSKSLGDEDVPVPSGAVSQDSHRHEKGDERLGEQYTTTCSVCGKPAHINFKPDGVRPVYCSSCLKKIQSGEIQAPGKKTYDDTLGALGIEFEGGGKVVPVTPPVHKKVQQAPVKTGELVTKETQQKPISLKELTQKPSSQHSHQNPQAQGRTRQGPHMEGLKAALKSALGASKKEVSRESATPPSKDTRTTLRPGESIKF